MSPQQFLQHFPQHLIVNPKEGSRDGWQTVMRDLPKTQGVGRAVFFTPNGFDKLSREESDVVRFNSVYIDVDCPKDDRTPEAIQEFVKKKIGEIYTTLEPSFIVRTKNGAHFHFLLSEPLDVTEESKRNYIYVMDNMVKYFGADLGAKGINRVLRVPEFKHYKDVGDPFEVTLLHTEPDNKYTLNQIADAIGVVYPAPVKTEIESVSGKFTYDMQSRLERMLKSDNVKKLYDGDTSHYDNDTSRADSALCCHLAFWFDRDPQIMEQVWLASPLGSREKTQQRADYRAQTIERAIGLTKEVYTPKVKSEAINTETCFERQAYQKHLKDGLWESKEWLDQLKKLKTRYIANFHKFVAIEYPHMLFELGEDKSYWKYDGDKGVYEGLNFSTVRGLVIKLLIDEGFEVEATETTVKNVLAKYRSVFLHKGVTFNSFISHEDYFHVANGWLNTKTRELTPHTPNRLSLYKSKVQYNPRAQGTLYNNMLDSEYRLPADAIRVIDQFSGYILTHRVDQQKMLVFEGRPGCGKSTLPRIWLDLLGEKATTASLGSLSGNEVRFMGGNFVNKNFCFFDEANPKTENINEYFMSMADQKTIRVERKGIQGVETPQYTMKVVLSLNKMPYHQPEGFKRRYRHILFERSFTDEGVEDTDLLEKVTESDEEMSAVLNRMLDGLDDLRKMGKFTMIAGEDERKREHTIAADTMSEFLDTYFEPVYDDEVRYTFQELKEAYQELFPTSFNRGLSTAGFNKEILNPRLSEFRMIRKKKKHGAWGYAGLKIKNGYHLGLISRGNEERNIIKINVHDVDFD